FGKRLLATLPELGEVGRVSSIGENFDVSVPFALTSRVTSASEDPSGSFATARRDDIGGSRSLAGAGVALEVARFFAENLSVGEVPRFVHVELTATHVETEVTASDGELGEQVAEELESSATDDRCSSSKVGTNGDRTRTGD